MPAKKTYHSDSFELKPSSEWADTVGYKVVDPYGWDMTNFDESWAEPIPFTEFQIRAMKSVIEWRRSL